MTVAGLASRLGNNDPYVILVSSHPSTSTLIAVFAEIFHFCWTNLMKIASSNAAPRDIVVDLSKTSPATSGVAVILDRDLTWAVLTAVVVAVWLA